MTMYFQILSVIFGQKCSSDDIKLIDQALHTVWQNKNWRHGFRIGILKSNASRMDEQLLIYMVKDLVKCGLLEQRFAISCPDCGDETESYQMGQVKSVEELVDTTSHCDSCDIDFTIDIADVSIEYGFHEEFSPD